MKSELIVESLYALAALYDYEVPEEIIPIWQAALSDLTIEELNLAIKLYVLSNQPFFPKPGQLYSLIKNPFEVKTQASNIADSIFTSVRLYGSDKVGTARARLKIGDIGWQYILNNGGWELFIESVSSEEVVPTMKAQARISIEGLITQNIRDREISQQPENLKCLKDYNIELKKIE
jgi:hypothetical protein